MHSDVLELFIIANSVPVLHLTQDRSIKTSDTVLKAGRISAQDMLGEEATGELIEREVLADSTINYARMGEILVALRVSKSMSQSGVDSLLADILLQVNNFIDLVWSSFGDTSMLKPLTKRLELTLGAKLPTNPFGIATIKSVMESYFERIGYIDSIGIVTQESWLVDVISRDSRPVAPVSKDIWKNTVELIYASLGSGTRGLLVHDERSIFWVRPIYYHNRNTSSGISWWAIVAQLNMEELLEQGHATPGSGIFNHSYVLNDSFYNECLKGLDGDFFLSIAQPINQMVEKEIKGLYRLGVLGQVLSFVEYQLTSNEEYEISENIEDKYIALRGEDSNVYPWTSFLSNYKEIIREGKKSSLVNQISTISVSLHLSDVEMILSYLLPGFSTSQAVTEVHLGTSFFINIAQYSETLNQIGEKIALYSEDQINISNLKATIVDNVDVDSQISQYVFLLAKLSELEISIILFNESGDEFSGIWSHDSDVYDLAISRIGNLDEMETQL